MRVTQRLWTDVGRAVGAAAGAQLLCGGTTHAKGAIVFAYHDVGDNPGGLEYFVTPSQLKDQLASAQRWGFEFVDLGELRAALVRGDDVSGLAAVSFDDALLGVHRHALEVLSDLRIEATVFVVADSIGQDPWWWHGASRVLTDEELREVTAAGHRIGSHTCTHASLPNVDAPQLERELAGSRASLEDRFGQRIDLLAYPSGHHDARVREQAHAAGYRAAFTFLNGRVTARLDMFELPRLTMSGQQGRGRLAYQLARPAWSWPDHQVDVPG